MNNLEKKKIIVKTALITLIIALLIFALAYVFLSARIQIHSNNVQEKYLQAMIADPDAVQVLDNNKNDITEDFFEKYTESIENGDYKAVMNAIRENQYTYSIKKTPKNRKYLE